MTVLHANAYEVPVWKVRLNQPCPDGLLLSLRLVFPEYVFNLFAYKKGVQMYRKTKVDGTFVYLTKEEVGEVVYHINKYINSM